MIKDLKYFSEAVAFVALGVSICAAVASYYIAEKQNEISADTLLLTESALLQSRTNARKENCIAMAAIYLPESWNHGSIENGEQDGDLKDYGGIALEIARALQLCQVKHGADDEGLRGCIDKLVDSDNDHKVDEEGNDGETYTNLVC